MQPQLQPALPPLPQPRIIRLPPLSQSNSKKERKLAQSATQKDIRNETNELKALLQNKMGVHGNNMKHFSVKSDFLKNLKSLIPNKTFKKTRWRKTEFKIPRNSGNVLKMQGFICNFIDKHKNLKNSEIVINKDYDKNAPFIYGSLDFVEEILKDRKVINEKFGYEVGNLIKNNLVLEKVLLTRLTKREDNLKNLALMNKPLIKT